MKSSLITFFIVAVAAASSDYFQEWNDWKSTYSKTYDTPAEEYERQMIWTANKKYVLEHNSKINVGFMLEMNAFADMTVEEFSKTYNGYRPSSDRSFSSSNRTRLYTPSGAKLPATVDWRDKGIVTGIKNQGKCGSCWAFSATGSLEGQHANKTGHLVSLSEQNLVDCEREDDGCKGGTMIHAFEYIKKNGGIDTEESYPYVAKNEKCHFKKDDVGATVTGYVKIKKESCQDLKDAVANVGPISVAMDASHISFQLYNKGIYDPKKCSKTKLDHGVLVVGYGSENGVEYWIVKNSWGRSWGMEGYFKIASKGDECGLCTSASYPTV